MYVYVFPSKTKMIAKHTHSFNDSEFASGNIFLGSLFA